jgi:tRNA (mo5U34)-methyltransferase
MNYQKLFDVLSAHSMGKWSDHLSSQTQEYFANINHGDYRRWQSAIDQLPDIKPSKVILDSDCVVIGDNSDCDDINKLSLQIKTLMPWRKGPFDFFGIYVDTEWRSNLKWSRLNQSIKPLENRLVLDIGCGNGYYGWRMLGEKARHVVGLDPSLLFYMQFCAVKKYIPDANIDILPFGIQELPGFELNFDTVFTMGVIYHRRDPVEHLKQCLDCLNSGGELVLETLIIDDDELDVLIPEKRYAKMNNVWAIPNVTKLIAWAVAAGFVNVRIVDITKTTSAEQRRTEWMTFESLDDYLDKYDKTKTVEGYPAPMRAILLADKP